MSSALRVGIIGNGNAGNYFSRNFLFPHVELFHFARNAKENLIDLTEYSSSYNLDLLLLAVSDKEIESLSESLESSETLIVHLSGTTPISKISEKHLNRAVFWPLMSLSQHTQAKLVEIPFCLEANNEKTKKVLEGFCDSLNLKRQWTDYGQRLKLHLAAVLSQNFTNHLFHLAHEILEKEDLDIELFKPILLETVNRLDKNDPKQFQTGPALRNDETTIQRHLDLLEGSSKEIYKIISQSIQETHERKL